MSDTFAMIVLIADTTQKLTNKTRYKIFGYRVFAPERIGKLYLKFKNNFYFATENLD